jgi:hypothetical protein
MSNIPIRFTKCLVLAALLACTNAGGTAAATVPDGAIAEQGAEELAGGEDGAFAATAGSVALAAPEVAEASAPEEAEASLAHAKASINAGAA